MVIDGERIGGVVFDLQDTLFVGGLHNENAIVRSGLIAGLEYLRAQGVKTGLMTRAEEFDTRSLLHRYGASEFFDPLDVLGRDSVRNISRMEEMLVRVPGLLGKVLGLRAVVQQGVTKPRLIEPKPSSEGMRYLMDSWQLQPNQIVYIGDEDDDRYVASGVGAHFRKIPAIAYDFDGGVDLAEFLQQISPLH